LPGVDLQFLDCLTLSLFTVPADLVIWYIMMQRVIKHAIENCLFCLKMMLIVSSERKLGMEMEKMYSGAEGSDEATEAAAPATRSV